MKLTLKLHKAKLVWGQMVEAPECLFRQFERNVEVEGWGGQQSSWLDIFFRRTSLAVDGHLGEEKTNYPGPTSNHLEWMTERGRHQI